MTSPQARLLLLLARTEGENQGFYAERLEVEPISLARMIDRMGDAGLLERRPDPADRRAWRIHLTERARDMVDAVRRAAIPLEEQLLTGLSPTQHEDLARSLLAIRANLSTNREAGVAAHG
jgi:DNA-binding MarR family transcriptional regulator